MEEIIRQLTAYLQYPFVRYAFLAGVLIALSASLLGVTLVLKRYSYIGDGLSHVAFGAMAVAMVLKLGNQMLLILPVTIVCAVLLLRTGEQAKIKGDAAVAMLSVASLAFGYLVINLFSASANLSGDVCTTLFGSTSILTLTGWDVAVCGALSLFVICFFVLFYHQIFSVTFDESFARASGNQVERYNLLMAAVIAVIIVLAMNLVGSLLISALIIFPALSAMRLFQSFRGVTIFSAFLSVVCALLGITASILLGTPVGSTIVAADAAAFVLCWGVSKARSKAGALRGSCMALCVVMVLLMEACGDSGRGRSVLTGSAKQSVKDVLQSQAGESAAGNNRAEESRENSNAETAPAGGTAAGGTTPAGGAASGGTAPAGGTIAGGIAPAGGTSAGGTAPAGGTVAGGTTPAGGTSAGGTAPVGGAAAGGAVAGGTAPVGGTVAGGTAPAGGTVVGGTAPAGGEAAGGTAPAGGAAPTGGAATPGKSGDVDVDLTQLSSTMVFAEVYHIMVEPKDYMGKRIRISGISTVYEDQKAGKSYYSCVVLDATACCAQGIEFKLRDGGHYPENDEEITVQGTFDTYEDGGYQYAILKDAVLESSGPKHEEP